MSIIPTGLKDLHNKILTDIFNSEWAKDCLVVYPPVISSCPNCLLNTMTGTSSGKYNGTGPISFTEGGICPVCNGEGSYKTETSETIKVLVHYDKASYISAGFQIDIEDGIVMLEGKVSDKEKLIRADKIILFPENNGEKQITFVRHGPFLPKGIGKDSFFYVLFERAG